MWEEISYEEFSDVLTGQTGVYYKAEMEIGASMITQILDSEKEPLLQLYKQWRCERKFYKWKNNYGEGVTG